MSERFDVEVEKVEFYWSLRGPIVLTGKKGSMPRERMAEWEKTFTEYLCMVPNEKIAFKVIIRDAATDMRFSSVLVFSRDRVLVGQGVKNGTLFKEALGT